MVQVKKAMMYSILTVMLLGLVIMLASAFIEREAFTSQLAAESFTGTDFLRLQSTIATDYLAMTGLDIERLSSKDMLLEHSFRLTEDEPLMKPILNEYIHYFENHYAEERNIHADLGLQPYLFIQPFEYTLKRTHYNYTASLGNDIEKISLEVNLSESEDYLNTTNFDYTNGTTTLEMVFYENTSEEIIDFEHDINIDSTNTFEMEFNSTERRPKFYVEVDEKDLKLQARKGLNASINLIYEFSSDKSKIYLNTGTSTRLKSRQEDFSIEEPITLMSG